MLDAAWDYAAATGRRVSIEYAMIRDINDQAWRAEALADLLAGRLAHVNLIPLNPTPGLAVDGLGPGGGRGSSSQRLAARGVPVTVRDTRGTRDRRRLRPAGRHRPASPIRRRPDAAGGPAAARRCSLTPR